MRCGAAGPVSEPPARFLRREDDANVLVGPVDNPKLELRGCTREWTIEAWVRHTGGSEKNGYRNTCGSDDEGVGLTDGVRGGWNFFLIAPRIDRAWVLDRGIGPHARFFGAYTRAPAMTSIRSAGPTRLSSSPMMSGTMWRGSFGTKIRCISCSWTGS